MKKTALIIVALLAVIATSAGTTVATAYFAPDLLPQAERGERGPQGPQGNAGVMGPRGLPGEDGHDGSDGVDSVLATTSLDEFEDLSEDIEENADADRDRLCSSLYDEGDFSSEAWRNECSGGRW